MYNVDSTLYTLHYTFYMYYFLSHLFLQLFPFPVFLLSPKILTHTYYNVFKGCVGCRVEKLDDGNDNDNDNDDGIGV